VARRVDVDGVFLGIKAQTIDALQAFSKLEDFGGGDSFDRDISGLALGVPARVFPV